MTVYTPVATLDTSYTLPDDGDDADAASVNVVFEALADGVKHYASKRIFKITGGESSTPLGSPTVTSTTYIENIGAPLLSIPSVSVGDRVNIWYTCHQYSTGDGRHKLALGPSKNDAYGAYTYTRAGYSQFTLMARFDVLAGHLNAGALDIYLMSKIESTGYVNPLQPHFMIVEVEKP